MAEVLHRAMKADANGVPELGESSRALGARPGVDIPVAPDGTVEPRAGGMSVAPRDPRNLPRHRRPRRFGGTGIDPVFVMDEGALPGRLTYRPDPVRPDRHGFIEPSERMTFREYQEAIWESSDARSRVGES